MTSHQGPIVTTRGHIASPPQQRIAGQEDALPTPVLSHPLEVETRKPSPGGNRQTQWTPEAVRALGVHTDLVTAGSLLGIGRTKAHELARRNEFPVPVLRHGRRYIVPVGPIARLLQLTEPGHADENTDTA